MLKEKKKKFSSKGSSIVQVIRVTDCYRRDTPALHTFEPAPPTLSPLPPQHTRGAKGVFGRKASRKKKEKTRKNFSHAQITKKKRSKNNPRKVQRTLTPGRLRNGKRKNNNIGQRTVLLLSFQPSSQRMFVSFSIGHYLSKRKGVYIAANKKITETGIHYCLRVYRGKKNKKRKTRNLLQF